MPQPKITASHCSNGQSGDVRYYVLGDNTDVFPNWPNHWQWDHMPHEEDGELRDHNVDKTDE